MNKTGEVPALKALHGSRETDLTQINNDWVVISAILRNKAGREMWDWVGARWPTDKMTFEQRREVRSVQVEEEHESLKQERTCLS